MDKVIFIEEYLPLSEDYTSIMLEEIIGDKERGIIIESFNTDDVVISSARMGGSSGLKSLAHTFDTSMKHDWFKELNLTPDTVNEIKRLNKIGGYKETSDTATFGVYDEDNFMFDGFEILTTDSPECLGNFNKVTKGNRHTYPHWFKGKY